jgi:NAD(P)-dependent dehydrogenase (short-subunit alcohol dehydrogenase family)
MRTAMVTGTSRGLGLEFVRQYAAEGWRVFALARSSTAPLEELRLRHRQVAVYPLDVCDHRQIEHLGRQLKGESIDVLINNAGVYGNVPFSDEGLVAQSFGHMDYQDWERTLRINVFGPMKMAEVFVENVARGTPGKIITITSELGSMELNRIGGVYGYRSSKAAVNSIMKSMSIDLAKRGVLAFALHPGWAKTDMGGSNAPVQVAASVSGMRAIIEKLSREQLGQVLAYDGSTLPY